MQYNPKYTYQLIMHRNKLALTKNTLVPHLGSYYLESNVTHHFGLLYISFNMVDGGQTVQMIPVQLTDRFDHTELMEHISIQYRRIELSDSAVRIYDLMGVEQDICVPENIIPHGARRSGKLAVVGYKIEPAVIID